MKKLTNKKGFTLTELIVVIAIIAILSAVLIPALTGYIRTARQSAFEQKADGIDTIMEGYLTEIVAGTIETETVEGVEKPITFEAYYQSIANTPLDSQGVTIAVSDGGVVTYTDSTNTSLTVQKTFIGELATAVNAATTTAAYTPA